jgi:hypothetical protein
VGLGLASSISFDARRASAGSRVFPSWLGWVALVAGCFGIKVALLTVGVGASDSQEHTCRYRRYIACSTLCDFWARQIPSLPHLTPPSSPILIHRSHPAWLRLYLIRRPRRPLTRTTLTTTTACMASTTPTVTRYTTGCARTAPSCS